MSESIGNLTNELMVLVNNAERRLATYRKMGRDAQAKAKAGHPNYPVAVFTERQAAEAILSHEIEDRFQWMTDDINPLPTRRFPKDVDRGPTGREDDPHEERKVMIAALAVFALRRVDWLEMARDILDGLDEIDACHNSGD